MDEEGFRRKVSKHIAPHAYVRVAWNPNRRGVPDMHVVCQGRAVWLELKYTESYPSLPHPVSAPQCAEMHDLTEYGALCGVLTGTPDQVAFTPSEAFDIGVHHRLPDETDTFDTLDDWWSWLDAQVSPTGGDT